MNSPTLRASLLRVACGLAAALAICAPPARAQNLTFEDIRKLPAPPADRRIAYGSDPSQFGDLRLPEGTGPHPVVIVVHGGCWFSEYDLNHLASFSAALTRLGVATWSLEYRRIGQSGGGWPGTFADVARGADYLRVLARRYPLDLRRVIVVGHSAGGQLALWLAARRRLPKDSPLYAPHPLTLRGVVPLAGITDLRRYRPRCGDAVTKLLGGSPEDVALRYQQTSPVELLPVGVPQRLIQGEQDRIVPIEFGRDYEAAARNSGDDVHLSVIPAAGHFELIAPQSAAWPVIEEAINTLLRSGQPHKHRRPPAHRGRQLKPPTAGRRPYRGR